MGWHRFGKAFIHPAPSLQSPVDGTFTRLEALAAQIVDQQIRAPAGFTVAILTGTMREHLVHYREGGLLFAIGAAGRWGVGESLDPIGHIRFEPTPDGVFMTTDGLGNDGNTVATTREQDGQTALRQV